MWLTLTAYSLAMVMLMSGEGPLQGTAGEGPLQGPLQGTAVASSHQPRRGRR